MGTTTKVVHRVRVSNEHTTYLHEHLHSVAQDTTTHLYTLLGSLRALRRPKVELPGEGVASNTRASDVHRATSHGFHYVGEETPEADRTIPYPSRQDKDDKGQSFQSPRDRSFHNSDARPAAQKKSISLKKPVIFVTCTSSARHLPRGSSLLSHVPGLKLLSPSIGTAHLNLISTQITVHKLSRPDLSHIRITNVIFPTPSPQW